MKVENMFLEAIDLGFGAQLPEVRDMVAAAKAYLLVGKARRPALQFLPRPTTNIPYTVKWGEVNEFLVAWNNLPERVREKYVRLMPPPFRAHIRYRNRFVSNALSRLPREIADAIDDRRSFASFV